MRILFHADLNHGQAAVVWRCRELLQTNHGIELLEIGCGPAYDLALVHSTQDRWETFVENDRPLVVLERIDGAQLSAPVRKHLGHPNLKAVIKNTIYADWQQYNRGSWRPHEEIMRAAIAGRVAEQNERPESEWITPEQYAKLKLGFSFAAYPHMDAIRNLEPFELSRPRPYTAHFAGTTDYGPEMGWLNWHRRCAVCEIGKLPANYAAVIGERRTMQFPEYFQTLRESEFVVSPWGLGEPCYRDFEAVLSGCMVIKPDTRHILTVPGPFYRLPQIERNICKPDFSDLQSVIETAQRVDIGDRIQWARHVADENSTPAIARRLARIFKEAAQ